MRTRDVAQDIRDRLMDEYEEQVLAVGWYSDEAEQRTGSVYMGDTFGEYTKETGQGALETEMLESIGKGARERIHGEDLTTTVRMYETIADISLHLGELKGVVVAVRIDEKYHVGDCLQAARETISDTL